MSNERAAAGQAQGEEPLQFDWSRGKNRRSRFRPTGAFWLSRSIPFCFRNLLTCVRMGRTPTKSKTVEPLSIKTWLRTFTSQPFWLLVYHCLHTPVGQQFCAVPYCLALLMMKPLFRNPTASEGYELTLREKQNRRLVRTPS